MLDPAQFLNHVIAPGNYLTLATQTPRGIYHKWFARSDVGGAAAYLQSMVMQGRECWHAVASYKDNSQRRQTNVELIRCFWFDADVKRDGDGKDPAKVYPDVASAVSGLLPLKASGFPLPNVWVRSGYGVHFYWVFEDPLSRDDWQPHADAFKALLVQHNLKGDIGTTGDSARILRPVGGVNFKDPANPAPCYDMTPASITNLLYPNANLLPHLNNHITVIQNTLSGPAPAVPIKQTLTSKAKIERQARPRTVASVAAVCAQLQKSLDEGGAADDRPIWHAVVGVAFYCGDRPGAHAAGDQHPKYTVAGTDKEYDQWVIDHKSKRMGAPLCKTFDAARPGICQSCSLWSEQRSPYSFGAEEQQPEEPDDADPDALPGNGYRRNEGWIEYWRTINKKSGYAQLIEGDIVNVGLSTSGGTNHLHFTYNNGSRSQEVQVDELEIRADLNHLKAFFARLGITLNFDNSIPFGKLLMAWIEKLRHRKQREALPAIGWAKRADEYIGFSAGGVCYRADGSQDSVASDTEALRDRAPSGSFAAWREAATLAGGGHPVTEATIAIAFGAPLLEFTGEAGLCVSIVGKTATGKTSAFLAGAAVWGRPKATMYSLDDTDNYVNIRIGKTHHLPAYWDETVVSQDRAAKIVQFVHKLTQGRDKGRAMADTSTRQSGEWNTLVAMSSNRSILDLVGGESNETDAAMLRVFELQLERTMPVDLRAAPVIAKLNDNYGHAGAVYARFIAANVPAICGAIAKTKDYVAGRTGGMKQDERFYVAGICSIIVGATIARSLDLLQFDVAAIRDELISTLLRLRQERQTALPVHNDRLMAVEQLNAYINAHLQEGVVTAYIKPPGRFTPDPDFNLSPNPNFHKLPTPAFQIAVREALIRIDREHWRNWCTSTRRNSRGLVKLFVSQFGARPEERGTIGAGTMFTTPRARYMEVSLASPDLAHWVTGFQPVAGAGRNVLPLRPVARP